MSEYQRCVHGLGVDSYCAACEGEELLDANVELSNEVARLRAENDRLAVALDRAVRADECHRLAQRVIDLERVLRKGLVAAELYPNKGDERHPVLAGFREAARLLLTEGADP